MKLSYIPQLRPNLDPLVAQQLTDMWNEISRVVNANAEGLGSVQASVTSTGGPNIVNNNITNNIIGTVLTFELPGTQQVSNDPNAPPVEPRRVLNNVTYVNGVIAKLDSAPTGSAYIITWWRRPPGGAPVLLVTCTIPIGATDSGPSGPVTLFARDSVFILIQQVGSALAGDNLITGVVG